MTDFNVWSASALWTLLEVSVQATLCLTVILVVRRALGKYLRPDWRYALWAILIFRMLLPLNISAPLLSYSIPNPASPSETPAPPSELPAPPQQIAAPTAAVIRSIDTADQPSEARATTLESALDLTPTPAPVVVPIAVETEAAMDTPAPREFPWFATLFLTWLAGAIAVFGAVVYRHVHLTRAIERDATPAPDSLAQILRQVREDLRVSLWPVVLITPSIATPTVIGVLRPRILLPKGLAESASRDELRLILMHELMHLRHHDLWFAWLWLAALSLHWFNPVLWIAGARIRRDREFACDQRVLAALPETDRAAYGHTLLKSLTAMNREQRFTRLAASAAIVEDEAELENRLTLIKSYRPARTHHRISGAIAALALACAAFIQTWAIAQQPTTPKVPSAPSTPAPAASTTTSTSSTESTPSTTPPTPPNPFADISDESRLVALRDEAAKSGDIVRACEAEMRRVKLRAANGNPYKDKIDFTDLYRNLPRIPLGKEHTKRSEDLAAYLEDKTAQGGDPDYVWRIFHLMSMMARDDGSTDVKGPLANAIRAYPMITYTDPSKHSKFQHLVNEMAMWNWDHVGVDAAENYVSRLWKKDRRFAYFFDAPWEARYAAERWPSERLDELRENMGNKAPLNQVTILVLPDGLWYVEKRATWEEIEGYLKDIPSRFDYFIALGYTSDEIPMKSWREAQGKLVNLAKDLGFDHFSDIGLQQAPSEAAPPVASKDVDVAVLVDRSDPNEVGMDAEIERYYFNTSPEVQAFLRTTAKTFGSSGLWKPEYPSRQDAYSINVRVENLVKSLTEGTYGRPLCQTLAQASTYKDPRLVPALMKIAAYHRDDQDYDCRPKWMAIAALARQDDETAVPVLVPLVDHGNLNTRMWAQAALARITHQSFGPDKQAWANWWNAVGKTPALGPDAVKPWIPPTKN